jgi:cytochrome c oxidase subunit 2
MLDWLTLSNYLGMPADISTHGHEIDLTMGLVHWLMIILFLVWAPYFLYTLYRFRASNNPEASYEGSESSWSSYLEIGVIVAEAVLLVGFAFPIWADLKQDFPAEEEAVVVHVIAQQFAWNIHYPGPDGRFGRRDTALVDVQANPIGLDRADPYAEDDIVVTDELHLPVDRPTIVHLTSTDVIHSFFLPPLRVKQDAIPGLSIPIWFEPTETGEWDIACAQLCGVGHYRMRGYLTVHTAEEFEAWLRSEAPDSPDG